MIEVIVKAPDLLKWVSSLAKKKTKIVAATARALNSVGDRLVDEIVRSAAAQTGLPEEQVRRGVDVSKASPSNLMFHIDAANAMIEEPTRSMPGERRFSRRPSGYFQAGELVDLLTWEDEKVCPICQEVKENGPYTIEEIRALGARNTYGHGLLHVNCRCAVTPHRSRRELPVQFKKNKQVQISRVTMGQLAKALRDEISISLKAEL